jgi:NADPH-dependent ferric siderophore reductase
VVSDTPIRREPPAFRRVGVVRTADRTPRLRRITVGGPALGGFDIGLPAASVRLLVPRPGESEPEIPTWTGNEFLASDGSRPAIRTLTPMRFDPIANELDVDVVLHGEGPLSTWADQAGEGDAVAVAGTGRGYTIDPEASTFLLAGDESALPAISLLVPSLPPTAAVTVIVELGDPAGELTLEPPTGSPNTPEIEWVVNHTDDPGSALVSAVTNWLTPERAAGDLKIWVAGEAASVQRIRRYAFEDLAIARSKATIRGYWKRGRAEGTVPMTD